jgi:GNAT superfamily N-acetyltransferase
MTTVRVATMEDAPQLAALGGELGYDVSVAEMRVRLAAVIGRLDTIVLAAETQSNELAGWLHAGVHPLLTAPATAEILALVVGRAHRRIGAGRQLVAAAEAWATASGVATLVVRSNVVRVESHAFYPGVGFERSKTQHVYRKSLSSRAAGEVA